MSPTDSAAGPQISFVVPAYNEEAVLASTLRRLLDAFEGAGVRLELVVVDNGSVDRTGEVLAELAARSPTVRPVRVEVNRGYGFGLLQGVPHCAAPWIGFIPADGQIDAEDVVRLYEAVQASDGLVIAKARRRFRLDGIKRKFVSVAYNLLVVALWPRIGSLDINGTPKILHRNVLRALDLSSEGWLFDPELMIKAHYLGVRVIELNVFSRMRGNGLSHVRASTCWDFLRGLAVLRFSPSLRRWRRGARIDPPAAGAAAPVAQPRETTAR
jgi:glycosyltransferase involved in cell wall biosynthesis